MSEDAKQNAIKMFDFVRRCYPDVLIGLKIPNSPTVWRTYLYGVLRTTMVAKGMDTYTKACLLNMLREEIGLSAKELAADILKYAADK